MQCDKPTKNDSNQNLAQSEAMDDSVMTEVTSDLSNFRFEEENNKENEQKQLPPSQTSKKWYEGVVIRPVAFRSTTKRLDPN